MRREEQTESDSQRTAPESRTGDSRPERSVVPLRGRRKAIAEHMKLSWSQVARVTTVVQCDMGAVLEHKAGSHATITSYVVKAVGDVLRAFPTFNALSDSDGLLLLDSVDINVAVARPEGLLTPVVRDVDEKSLGEVDQAIRDLVDKTNHKRLRTADTQRGGITVTNSGVFGALLFTPMVNYPQVGTLGVGKVMEDVVALDGRVAIRPRMYLCLSYDHRFVDGEMAVKFNESIRQRLEDAQTWNDVRSDAGGIDESHA